MDCYLRSGREQFVVHDTHTAANVEKGGALNALCLQRIQQQARRLVGTFPPIPLQVFRRVLVVELRLIALTPTAAHVGRSRTPQLNADNAALHSSASRGFRAWKSMPT